MVALVLPHYNTNQASLNLQGDDLVQTSNNVQLDNVDHSPLTMSEGNLGQTTQPPNVVKQPSSGNNGIETTLNVPEDNLGQTAGPENVNQSPLNVLGQTTDNLQPESQPSSSNYDGKFIIFYQTCNNCIISDEYVHVPENIPDVKFQGGQLIHKCIVNAFCVIFNNTTTGLYVCNQSKNVCIDIAEAPFQLSRSKRLMSLEGKFVISFNDKSSIKHVRCQILTEDDQGKLKGYLNTFEYITSTVAVLFINPSSELLLEQQFHIPDPNFCTSIPVYVTSYTNGQKIVDLTNAGDSCECQFMFDQNVDEADEHCHILQAKRK